MGQGSQSIAGRLGVGNNEKSFLAPHDPSERATKYDELS